MKHGIKTDAEYTEAITNQTWDKSRSNPCKENVLAPYFVQVLWAMIGFQAQTTLDLPGSYQKQTQILRRSWTENGVFVEVPKETEELYLSYLPVAIVVVITRS